MSTREKIKEAALHLFAEKGFVGMTMSEIAKEVGIKAPSIYAFYKNKQDLFLELYEDVLRDHSTIVAKQVDENVSIREQLYTLLKTTVDYQFETEQKNKIVIRLISFPPDFLEDEILIKFQEFETNEKKHIEQLLQIGIAQNEVKKLDLSFMSDTFLCLMDGLFWEMQRLSKEKMYQRVERVFEVYWSGIEATHER